MRRVPSPPPRRIGKRQPANVVRISAASEGRSRFGLARVISKLGIASRKLASQWIEAGRVSIDGKVVRDAEQRVDEVSQRIAIDGIDIAAQERIYIALHKPRGIVTSARDERGRDTVYAFLDDPPLPWLAPVGRLDKASEGLLLMSNDSAWAARITSPESSLDKTYHVQIDRLPDDRLLDTLIAGIDSDGERLIAKSARELRRGEKNAWLEIVLDEGRNRHIRRMLAALDISVLRLIRVAIGALVLGDLGKGEWRHLKLDEVAALQRVSD